jgi:hypothetical protein
MVSPHEIKTIYNIYTLTINANLRIKAHFIWAIIAKAYFTLRQIHVNRAAYTELQMLNHFANKKRQFAVIHSIRVNNAAIRAKGEIDVCD